MDIQSLFGRAFGGLSSSNEANQPNSAIAGCRRSSAGSRWTSRGHVELLVAKLIVGPLGYCSS